MFAEQGLCFSGPCVVERIDLAVMLACDVLLIKRRVMLLEKVAITIVGTPLGILEGGNRKAIITSMNANSVLGPTQSDGASRATLQVLCIIQSIRTSAALSFVNVGTSGAEPFQDSSGSGIECHHCRLLVASIDNGMVAIGIGAYFFD
ncbi:hypothetical protein HG530_014229 [Fusarium avenaceum]|nr:hypothetical protein HG530_014229 [Fusarium avenaceum]